MRFEYTNQAEGTWTWRLRTSVGEVIATGGSYSSRETCLSAIKLVKLAAGATSREVPAPLERARALQAGPA